MQHRGEVDATVTDSDPFLARRDHDRAAEALIGPDPVDLDAGNRSLELDDLVGPDLGHHDDPHVGGRPLTPTNMGFEGTRDRSISTATRRAGRGARCLA